MTGDSGAVNDRRHRFDALQFGRSLRRHRRRSPDLAQPKPFAAAQTHDQHPRRAQPARVSLFIPSRAAIRARIEQRGRLGLAAEIPLRDQPADRAIERTVDRTGRAAGRGDPRKQIDDDQIHIALSDIPLFYP